MNSCLNNIQSSEDIRTNDLALKIKMEHAQSCCSHVVLVRRKRFCGIYMFHAHIYRCVKIESFYVF